MYERLGQQTSRLGHCLGYVDGFGDLGQTTSTRIYGGEVASVINAISNGVVGVVNSIESNKTARAISEDKRDVAIQDIIGRTEQAQINAESTVAQSRHIVEATAIKYSGSTKIILALGLSLTAMILVGGVAVKVSKNKRK